MPTERPVSNNRQSSEISDAKLEELFIKHQLLPLSHLTCEDPWYSCPKCEEGCANPGAGIDCDCGSEWQYAKEMAMARELQRETRRETLIEAARIAQASGEYFVRAGDYGGAAFHAAAELERKAKEAKNG